MVAALRPSVWMLITVAAPFTLLVDMAMSLFGPEPPRSLAAMTPQLVILLIVIPGLIGAIAQLTVARLLTAPEVTPRAALVTTFDVYPAYLAALLLSAAPIAVAALVLSLLPTGFGLLLAVPAFYLAARLFLIMPIAVSERLGPVAILKRSWQLTNGRGATIIGFLVLGMLVALGVALLAGGVGAAFGSVFKIIGLGAIGIFVSTLIKALVSTLLSVASAAAAAVIYLKLR